MGGGEVRWVKQPGGVPLLLLALAVGVLWVAARHAAVSAEPLERWAALPAGVEVRVAAAPRAYHAEEDVLRAYRPRPHTPPTWQQEREWAREDLRSLCQEARQMVRALDSGAGLPLNDARGREAAVGRRRLRSLLVCASQKQAKVEAALGQAHGFPDILAAYREIGRIRSDVGQTRSWFRARRLSGPRFVRPRRNVSEGSVPGRVRDLPPAPHRGGRPIRGGLPPSGT